MDTWWGPLGRRSQHPDAQIICKAFPPHAAYRCQDHTDWFMKLCSVKTWHLGFAEVKHDSTWTPFRSHSDTCSSLRSVLPESIQTSPSCTRARKFCCIMVTCFSLFCYVTSLRMRPSQPDVVRILLYIFHMNPESDPSLLPNQVERSVLESTA